MTVKTMRQFLEAFVVFARDPLVEEEDQASPTP
jgi:hypothetical protein